MGRETVIETYEEKRARIREFNLTSDLFASKVFEDLAACQELYRILMQDAGIRLKAVKTQYVIRNLVGHSVQFDGGRDYRRYDRHRTADVQRTGAVQKNPLLYVLH